MVHRVKQPPRLRTLTLALLVLLIGAVGLSPYLGPVRVSTAAGRLELRAGFSLGRGTKLTLQSLEGLEKWSRLPAFSRRFSGYSFGGRTRGEFELAGLGKVSVFLENARPPYLFARGRDPELQPQGLLFSASDVAETERLYAELALLLPRGP